MCTPQRCCADHDSRPRAGFIAGVAVRPYDRLMMTRRDAMAALASTAALPLMSGCGGGGAPAASTGPAAPSDADALKLLDEVGDNLLKLGPEGAMLRGP